MMSHLSYDIVWSLKRLRLNSSNEWTRYEIIESEIKIIFLISAYYFRITYKGKTYQLKYLYFASIFKFHQRIRGIVRREDYLRYFSKDSAVQTNSIKWYLNIFAFLIWNRRYFYVITKTLNEEIKILIALMSLTYFLTRFVRERYSNEDLSWSQSVVFFNSTTSNDERRWTTV